MNTTERFQFQFASLHTECLTILEVLRSEDSSGIKLEETSAAFYRLLGAYKRCLENLRNHRADGAYTQETRDRLISMDQYETTRLDQLKLTWKAVLADYERARLLETSKERRKRRKANNTSHMIRDAKLRMQAELLRMEKIDQGLGEISGNIDKSSSLSGMYNNELRRARVFFAKVLTKAEDDRRYLQWSWLFLCGVCIYIILKRLNILRLGYWGLRLVLWVASLVRMLLVAVVLRSAHFFGLLNISTSEE
eukprot:Gregarina_sp_Poly_1__10132@NODE_691_length_6736_cov_671_948118_g521_i0_p5_GENE_NODE_691_length_6736_cov_671_948118_g521_i0NODE_691_length_6736_cov_671_948118_g521_i0_p5_ORF_typecomplete_len251_score35_14Sec20/PF03908_13/9_1e07Sec20/PF03908_13/1_8e04LRR19TM/PF15176_6/7_1LRR19TM/PF15176_6/1_6e02DUF2628/PF10947_8/0_7_NODE_691_length_6736_cov_671_948118_g521_i032544006